MSNEFYVVIENDVISNDIKVLHITNDYTSAINFFQSSYNIYVHNDDYITREYDLNFMYIYERHKGMIWNSKSLIKTFRLCKCDRRENIVSK